MVRMEEIQIPKLEPKEIPSGPSAESILIPKIGPNRSTGRPKPRPTTSANPKPKRKIKALKWTGLASGLLAALGLLIGIPALNVYGKAKLVYANSQRLSD